MAVDSKRELEVFQQIVSGLAELDKETQIRIIRSVSTFLEIETSNMGKRIRSSYLSDNIVGKNDTDETKIGFVDREEMSPKEFLLHKEPRTTVARVACLSYYLTHFRGISHFKTLDISKLNMEAAQPKFTNAAQSVNDAAKCGLLVAASRGNKQLSAMGEQYVIALPDQESAKRLISRIRRKRRKSSTGRRKKIK